MSLYNQLFGRNPYSPYLLGAIGITQENADKYPLGRIRDVHTNDAGNRVFIYSTYEFSVPENTLSYAKEIAVASDNTPPMVQFQKLIADMQAGKDNAMTQHANKVGEKIAGKINEAMAGEGGKIVEIGLDDDINVRDV